MALFIDTTWSIWKKAAGGGGGGGEEALFIGPYVMSRTAGECVRDRAVIWNQSLSHILHVVQLSLHPYLHLGRGLSFFLSSWPRSQYHLGTPVRDEVLDRADFIKTFWLCCAWMLPWSATLHYTASLRAWANPRDRIAQSHPNCGLSGCHIAILGNSFTLLVHLSTHAAKVEKRMRNFLVCHFCEPFRRLLIMGFKQLHGHWDK
jgi:hypothetical protein